MFAITIDYLTGVCYANGRAAGRPDVPEWPPHPDRLFQALVASSTEHHHDALRWIASQLAPAIIASEAQSRTTLSMYSPANDRLPDRRQVTQKKKGNELAPYTSISAAYRVDRIHTMRQRAERRIASTVPDEPRVTFVWQSTPPDDVRASVVDLLSRVQYLGASESMVHATLDDKPTTPTWIPTEVGEIQIRVPYEGRLDDLQAAYSEGRRPSCPGWQGYTRVGREPPQAEWSDMTTYELSGVVDLRHAVRIARAVRRCLIAACPDPVPNWISGHDADGGQLRSSQAAIHALANVGHEYGDGRVLGVGIMRPSHVSIGEWSEGLVDFCREPQRIGKGITLSRRESSRATIDPFRWSRASQSWATVTPIVCSRWPKHGDIESVVRRDIEHAGLPEPESIEVRQTSAIAGGLYGSPQDAPSGYRTHLVCRWPTQVVGPIAIGRGRYLGMGLMASVARDEMLALSLKPRA